MYIKYYGIFRWIDDKLCGICTNYKWYHGFVYRETNLNFFINFLQEHKEYPEYKDAFILKISGRYFTSIYKKYGILYKIGWDKINYYAAKYPKGYAHHNFYKHCISYRKIQ